MRSVTGSLSTGTVTFVFSDLEGSTSLLATLRQSYAGVLEDYYRLVGTPFGEKGGTEIDRAGDGLFYSFPSARAAVAAAIEAQRALAGHEWPSGLSVRARMGIHTGEPALSKIGFSGMDVHRAARIAAAGHGGQVLASQTTRELVADELGSDVSLVDLGEHWLKDLTHPEHLFQLSAKGLPAAFPPLRSLVTLPNNLPRHLSSFIGRRRDLDEARELLAEAPLLTLTGSGGVGKTRLAVQLAAELLDTFEDGAWMVELETLSEEQLLAQTVAAALGISEASDGDFQQTLLHHLRSRQALLILDNCEHIIDACARLANILLRNCPGLRVLATSREALGVPGEKLYPVKSLSMPSVDRLPPTDALTGFEAIQLFVERALAADPQFELTDARARAVVEICHRLDGIPLAIELAAARARALTVEQIAARLDDRFRLLTGGSRTVLPRHQTLRAAMEWSFELLPEPERAVLWRLAVFAGPFTLEAAESVCAGPGVDSADVVEHITRLVEKSLVNRHGPGFRLLETVREYARDHLLAARESEATYARHRDWYAGFVNRGAPAFFRGPESNEWLENFEREHDNLRTALQWSLDEGTSGARALELAAGLWRFWEIRGYLVEGRQWLQRVLERTRGQLSATRADVLTGAGIIAAAQGDHAASVQFHQESLAAQEELGNQQAVTYAMNNLANATLLHGDHARARELYEVALGRARASDDRRGLPFSLMHVADVADQQGDYAGARDRYEEAVSIARAEGDAWALAYALGNFGQTAARHDDPATAREMYEEALRTYVQVGDRRGEARLLSRMADLAVTEGNPGRARSLLYDALTIRHQLGDVSGTCAALERISAAAVDDDPRRAVRLLAAAAAMRERIGARPSLTSQAELDQQIAQLQDQLGDAFVETWQSGRLCSLEDAMRDAQAMSGG
jgi:predicted ATPase/class 3 adenylate cyclase